MHACYMIGVRSASIFFCGCVVVCGFEGFHHKQLIWDAFNEVPGASAYASPSSAVEASSLVDSHENDEPDQYQHSMRPSGVSLASAKRRAKEYCEYHMSAAVGATNEHDLILAGRHLGRVLHLVQDGKHHWCSCGKSSNGSESANTCSTNCPSGIGNHGLPNCWIGLETWSFPYPYQIVTDFRPAPAQLEDALQASKLVLNEFVARVKSREASKHVCEDLP